MADLYTLIDRRSIPASQRKHLGVSLGSLEWLIKISPNVARYFIDVDRPELVPELWEEWLHESMGDLMALDVTLNVKEFTSWLLDDRLPGL